MKRKKILSQADLVRIWTRVVLRTVFLLAAIAFLIWILYLLNKPVGYQDCAIHTSD